MENTCELAGMIWSTCKNLELAQRLLNCNKSQFNRSCTWCKKLVCSSHSFCAYNVIACDECVVLDKSFILNGKTYYARKYNNIIPIDAIDESHPYFTQYIGMHTKKAKM